VNPNHPVNPDTLNVEVEFEGEEAALIERLHAALGCTTYAATLRVLILAGAVPILTSKAVREAINVLPMLAVVIR
jgi:hypothetical protein